MSKVEFLAYVGGIVRLAIASGCGAWLTRHGVTNLEAFASLLILLATGAWSVWAKRFAFITDLQALKNALANKGPNP